MSWEDAKLGQFFKIRHGYAFKSSFFSDEGEFVLLTPGNFYDEGGFKHKGEKETFYTGDVPESFILNKGDLIIAMTEQMEGLLGSSALVPNGNRYLHNQRLGLIIYLDDKSIDKRFLYYLFNTREVRHQINASASGTKVRHTAPERVYRVKFKRPPVDTQRKIAVILSAYDDLIENNLKRIALLEEAARQLYKEWFVRLRFPGHEHTRIMDGVPEGWEQVQVKDLGDVVTGKTPSTKETENFGGDILFVKTPDMHGKIFVTEAETLLTERGANTQAKKFIPSSSIMVSCIGTIGVVSINPFRCHTNQQINSIVPQSTELRYYIYFAAQDLKPRMEALGGGATMNNINKAKFETLPVVCPDGKLLTAFDEAVSPSFNQILNLQMQNQKLKQARDLLLPRLMSGEIPV